MAIWKSTKSKGVRYKESPTRKRGKRAERYYSIRYRRDGRSHEEGVGWESDGIRPEYCTTLRAELVTNIRTGRGHQSLRDRRDGEAALRQAKQDEEETQARDNIKFDVLAQRYLEWSENNRASWKDDKSRYHQHIRPYFGSIPTRDITIWNIERLKQDIKSKGKAPQTVLHCISLVRSMFYAASDLNLYNGHNPFVNLSKDKKKKLYKIPNASRLNWFNHEQANILLNELQDRSPQLHDISLLSLHTGLRAGEIFALTWADVDIQNEIITVRNPKNDEMRRAHMTPQVKAMLQRRKPDNVRLNTLVFTNRKGEKIRTVSEAFDRTIEKLKFNHGATSRRDRLVFHSLRHTYASWLAIQGTPLLVIKELMGHKKIEMTLKYAHLMPDNKKDAVLQLAENQGRKAVDIKEKKTRIQ